MQQTQALAGPALCPPTCNSETAQGGQRDREKDDRALEQFEKCSPVKSHRGLQPSRTQGPAHAPGWICFMAAVSRGFVWVTSWVKCGVHSIKSTILSFRGLLHKAAQGKPMIICRCLLTISSISPHVRAGEWPVLPHDVSRVSLTSCGCGEWTWAGAFCCQH